MTAEDVIKEVQENAGEWLEMTQDPAALVTGILANKVIKLQDHIKYLEKRLECQQHAKSSKV
jgi:flagellar biosynthesis chaperone FliJ